MKTIPDLLAAGDMAALAAALPHDLLERVKTALYNGDMARAMLASRPDARVDERGVTPRYAEWLHLRQHGQWSDGVPKWARDHAGRMNDMTAAAAVIEELARAAAPSPDREQVGGWSDPCAKCETPRATCPCGLCSKHRFGFNSGDGIATPATSAPMEAEQEWPSDRDAAIQACALMILGICKTEPQEVWPKRIEGRIRYMLSKLQPQAAEPRGLTLEQHEAIKWAIGVAHSGAKATPQGLVMFNHWKALCSLL